MLVLALSHSKGTVPNVLLCKKKIVASNGSVSSSKMYFMSTVIENVDMIELTESYSATKVHIPSYTQIQEFLTKICLYNLFLVLCLNY